MATAELSLKWVVEASRGAVIAVHAAGGLARGHVQALRLLRAAEGLCRSAVAVLQASDSKKTKGIGKDKDQRDLGKGKGKDSDVGMGIVPPQPVAQPRRRRRGRARAAAAPAAAPEFGDILAGEVAVAPRPQVLALPLRAAPAVVGAAAGVELFRLLMVLLLVRAGRSSLGGRARGRRAARPRRSCLRGASPPSRAWFLDPSWRVSSSFSMGRTRFPAVGFVVSKEVSLCGSFLRS